MSASCPNCGTAIEQDFGLVNCTGCGKLVSVDVDGIVQSAEVVHDFEGPPEGLSFQAETTPEEFAPIDPISEPVPEGMEGFQVMPEPTPDQPIQSNDVVAGEVIELGPIVDPHLQYQDASLGQDFTPQEALMSLDSFDAAAGGEPPAGASYEAAPDSAAESATGGEPMSPAMQLEDFSDAPPAEPVAPVPFNKEIADFANQDASGAAGSLTYEVEITGIDSGAVRTEVLQALVDPRFSWSQAELLRKIKSGRLILSPLHPAAAVIVVRRLQPLNVRLQWRQTRNG